MTTDRPTAPETPDGATVHRLWLAGVLPPDSYLRALDLVRDGAAWGRWGRRMVLALAVGQLLAAAVFFFAFNWQAIPGEARIAAALVGLTACAVAAGVVPSVLARHVLLMAAAMLTGVALAVLGQHYQTGADAWEAFALWAALILPWTLLASSAPLWLLWGIVAMIALSLADDTLDLDLPLVAHTILPLCFVIAREGLPGRVDRWLALTAQAAVVAVLGWLAVWELHAWLADGVPWGTGGLAALGLLTWLGAWRRRGDLAPLALTSCAAAVAVASATFLHVEGLFQTALGAAAMALLFAAVVSLLNRLRRARP